MFWFLLNFLILIFTTFYSTLNVIKFIFLRTYFLYFKSLHIIFLILTFTSNLSYFKKSDNRF